MDKFLERVKRERANESTEEDRNDQSLADLNQIITELQFNDQ